MLLLDPTSGAAHGWRIISSRGATVLQLPKRVVARATVKTKRDAATGLRLLEVAHRTAIVM